MVYQLLYFSKSRILVIVIRILLVFSPLCPGNKLLRLLFGNFLLNLVVIDGRFYDQCSLPSAKQPKKWQQFTFFYYVTQAKQTWRKVMYIVFTHRSLSLCSKMTFVLWPASRSEQGEHVRHRGLRGRRQESSLSQDGADLMAEVILQTLQNCS